MPMSLGINGIVIFYQKYDLIHNGIGIFCLKIQQNGTIELMYRLVHKINY